MIIKPPENKFILDACCGPKNMWYNKNHPNALYIDIRKEKKGYNKHDPQDSVEPDILCDFRHLPSEIQKIRFKLIAWDIPHLHSLGQTSMYRMKYGCLNAETWPKDLADGFNQLWGVLDNYGILLLKFNNSEIKFDDLLNLFHTKPLFYNITSARGEKLTKWFCFMKIPNHNEVR